MERLKEYSGELVSVVLASEFILLQPDRVFVA